MKIRIELKGNYSNVVYTGLSYHFDLFLWIYISIKTQEHHFDCSLTHSTADLSKMITDDMTFKYIP